MQKLFKDFARTHTHTFTAKYYAQGLVPVVSQAFVPVDDILVLT